MNYNQKDIENLNKMICAVWPYHPKIEMGKIIKLLDQSYIEREYEDIDIDKLDALEMNNMIGDVIHYLNKVGS